MKIKTVGGAVLMVMTLWFGAQAYAGSLVGVDGNGVPNYPGANNGKGPNHNDDGIPLFGGCNKKGDWCWGININPPKRHLPIEVYGGEARGLIARGQITHADLSTHGVFFLDVWSRYYGSSFMCTVNVGRRQYHCTEDL